MTLASVTHYAATYEQFAAPVYAEIRAEAFGEDIGQNGWLTAEEQDRFIESLALRPGERLLDVACGSGGPSLRIAERTGCAVVGIDRHADAVRAARRQAETGPVGAGATFLEADARAVLPFPDASFDAVICVDAIDHLPDRGATLGEWARVLRPGGRLVFTDPTVITGAITGEEFATRASVGAVLFVPPLYDAGALVEGGFEILRQENRTANVADVARRWYDARAARAAELRALEGEARFSGQQRFLEGAARLAGEGRLARLAFGARRR